MIKIDLNRYFFNRTAAVVLSIFLVSGCGFKPRGSGYGAIAGQTILLLSEDPYGMLERRIKEKLSNFDIDTDGEAKLLTHSSSILTEKNAIRIKSIKSRKEIISVDINGRPAEYESIITVNTSFQYANNQQQESQFSVQRDYRYDSTNNLAHDRELEILTSEMYNNLAQRIVDKYLRELSEQSLVNET